MSRPYRSGFGPSAYGFDQTFPPTELTGNPELPSFESHAGVLEVNRLREVA